MLLCFVDRVINYIFKPLNFKIMSAQSKVNLADFMSMEVENSNGQKSNAKRIAVQTMVCGKPMTISTNYSNWSKEYHELRVLINKFSKKCCSAFGGSLVSYSGENLKFKFTELGSIHSDLAKQFISSCKAKYPDYVKN